MPSGAPSGYSRAGRGRDAVAEVTYSTNPTPFTTTPNSQATLPWRLTRVSNAIPAAGRGPGR